MKNSRIVILSCVLSLLALGLVVLWDIDAVAKRELGQSPHFFWRQLGWAGLGIAIMVLVARRDYLRWHKFVVPVFAVATALLLASLFLGQTIPGLGRALVIGGNPFYPAPFCVLATVLCLASCLASWQDFARDTQPGPNHAARPVMSGFATSLLLFGVVWIWSALVLVRGSSTGLLLALTTLIVLWFGGARRWLVAMVYGSLAVGSIWCPWADLVHWRSHTDFYTWRFDVARCRPMSVVALSRGGWLGVGLGHGRVSGIEDPARATDFIGTVIGEELGGVTLMGLVLVHAALLGAGVFVSQSARDGWGFLLGLGITSLLGLQMLVNLGVVTTLLPFRAPALPFVSYAGADLIMMLACVGLLLSIASHSGAEAPANSDKGLEATSALPGGRR